MMDISLFNEEINRLRGSFGEKQFNAERARILYSRVKKYPYEIFVRVVDEAIADCKFAPTISEMTSQLWRRSANGERRPLEKEYFGDSNNGKVNCPDCEGSGYVDTIKITDGIDYIYTFRCRCKNGEMREDAFPVWSRAFYDMGHRPERKVKELRRKEAKQEIKEMIKPKEMKQLRDSLGVIQKGESK